jgi:hypothetical protein
MQKNPQNGDFISKTNWQSQKVGCSELLELLEEVENKKINYFL